MTKDVKAHSSSVSEGGITNIGYLNQGEKKEENEEGKDKGQEGWQKKFFNHLVQRYRFDTFGVSTEDILGIEFTLMEIYPQFSQYM